jgi:hypothetical protein
VLARFQLTPTAALDELQQRDRRRRRTAPSVTEQSSRPPPSLLPSDKTSSRLLAAHVSTSISLPPGSVETAALRQEQAPAPVSVSWLRVVQQTHRVLAHDGIPAIELTIRRSRWPGRSPRRSSSCGGRGTIPFDGMRSPGPLSAGDRIGDQAIVLTTNVCCCSTQRCVRRLGSVLRRQPPLCAEPYANL